MIMSFILSQILKKKVFEWNEKVFTEDDITNICKVEKVRIFEDHSLKPKGEYTIHEGVPFILLRPNLKREMRLWVGAHELGHHLIHYPVPHRFSKGTKRRMDREANFFAAIALIPTKIIEEKLLTEISVETALGEIMEEFAYPIDLILIRKDIYDTYKI